MTAAFAIALMTAVLGGTHAGPPVGVPRADPADFDFAKGSDSPCVPKRGAPGPRSAETCESLSEPQYFHGVWRVEFEMSNFTFMGRVDCFEARDNSCIHLEGRALPWPNRWACSREYEVEFVGRRSHHAVMMSFPQHRIVVERLISAKRLPDPYDDNCDPELHPELKAKK